MEPQEDRSLLQPPMRDVLDRSESGAPAAGQAVRDLFNTDEIFQRVVATADEEFERPVRLLFLSGLAAGLTLGLTFMARAALTGATPGDASGLVGNLLYPIGFLLIVMGRYQLFTENTLTPVTLVLTRIASLPLLLRVWGVVFAANVVGVAAVAYVLAATGVFDADSAAAAFTLGEHALTVAWGDLFWKGVFAGWLVASMVWLTHAARDSTARFLIVFVIMYLIPSADLFHCITSTCEVLYVYFRGAGDLVSCASFLAAVTLGNTAGGVGLVAILNFAQTRGVRFTDRDCGKLELTWREWLFGRYAGRPPRTRPSEAAPSLRNPSLEEVLTPPVRESDHAIGPAEASVALVQYGDFECPTSRRVALVVQRLAQRREGDVRYVWRHLPMSQQHPRAERAAVASEAAAEQGRFWDMHEKLLSHQDHLEESDLVGYAREIGLDVETFSRDVARGALSKRIGDDRRSGIESGVRSSSNLFVDGARYRGDFTPEAITQFARRLRYVEGDRPSRSRKASTHV